MSIRRRLMAWGGAASLAAAAVLGSLPALLGVTPAAAAAGPQAFLDQCANGPVATPTVCASPNSHTWVNGDLNPSKSHYTEGDFVPFRTLVTGLATGAATPHSLTIQWDTLRGGLHAYDYLGTYDATVAGADPTWEAGFTAGAPTTTFAIPVDTGNTVNQPSNQAFTLFGGTITGVSAYSSPALGSRAITVNFTATVADVVLAWSGHVASEADWGAGQAAATIPGSSYHMAVTALDGGSVGHQDRSLKVTNATVVGAGLDLLKSTTTVSFSQVGDTISYSYLLTNSGTVDLHAPYAVADDKATTVNCPSVPDPLTPGSSLTCTATYTVDAGDVAAGQVYNTATASATWLDARNHTQTVTSGPSSVTVPLVTGNVGLSLSKSASPTTYSGSGQTITYTYTLTNSGNLTLGPPYAVSDNKTTVTCPSVPAALTPGDTVTCTATYVTTGTDVTNQSVTNQATATATHGRTTVTSNQATATVNLALAPIPPGPTFVPNPALTAAKSASPTVYDHAGQVITYSYTLTNAGNVTLSGPFSVADSKIGTFTCSTAPSLAVGASLNCSNTYTIAAADLTSGTVSNVARGSGLYGGTTVQTDPVSATVTAIHPAVSVTKTASPGSVVLPGGNVTYTYVVTNTGDAVLAPVVVTDDVLGDIGSAPSLAPGASVTFTKTAFVGSSPVTNTATATGTDPLGMQVSAQATVSVTVVAGEVIISPVTPSTPTPAKGLAFTGTPVLAQLVVALGLMVFGSLLLGLSRKNPRRRRPVA